MQVLASQEVLCLLLVSIMTPEEAKRTFLTPAKMILISQEIFNQTPRKVCVNFRSPSQSGSTISPACLHRVTQGSYEDVPDSCNDDFDFISVRNHLIRPQERPVYIFRVLASLEVLRLLYDSIMSTKKAKRIFLTPSRMILILFSSGINFIDPKGGSYRFSNSQLVRKCSGTQLAAFVNIAYILT